MKTSDFDYYLPPERIAQHPPLRREDARLLVLDRKTGDIEHKLFPQILDYFNSGDLLVLNDARVIPARLFGKKIPTDGQVEVLLLNEQEPQIWTALIRPAKRAKPGTEINFGEGIKAVVRGRKEKGEVLIDFSGGGDILKTIERIGYPPLPHYIKRKLKNYPADLKKRDLERYQTVYAAKPGAVAAPTAGFHFTPGFLKKIEEKRVEIVYVTLYVGYGTFQPVKTENVEEHRLHAEYYEISRQTADKVNEIQKKGRCLWVVGTTAARALESAADRKGNLKASSAWTDIFIYPGYRFKLDFNLVTNFHLPRSTLIMLVSTLAGRDNILKAYGEAIEKDYRFYSFGDAMLII